MKAAIQFTWIINWVTCVALFNGPGSIGSTQTEETNSPLKMRVDSNPLSAEVKNRTSFSPVAKKVAPSVVNIYSTRTVKERQTPLLRNPPPRHFSNRDGEIDGFPRPRTERGLGSGVIVTENGFILTNNHVVEDSSDIRVALATGEEYLAQVIGTDPATDVALLKVEGEHFPAITLADSTQIDVGDTVLAIGNPFGVGQTVTLGIVSATGRAGFGIVNFEDFIQTDASINPGNSGGALTDVTGRLIGLNTAIISRTGGNQGVGFAVPINLARYVMAEIIAHGRVIRGYLGIHVQTLTLNLAKAFDITAKEGALVANVTPKSPAAKAGLQEGDVIVEFNDGKVPDSRHLQLMVSQTPPQTHAKLRLFREGKSVAVDVILGELPNEEMASTRARDESETRSGGASLMGGVEVAELDQPLRRQLDVPAAIGGLVITSVEASSGAERAGLRTGDVIVEVNRQSVHSLRDLIRIQKRSDNEMVLVRVWSNGESHYIALPAFDPPAKEMNKE